MLNVYGQTPLLNEALELLPETIEFKDNDSEIRSALEEISEQTLLLVVGQ